LVVLLVRMCRLKAALRRNLPEAVFLNRFAAPRWVFIFGMTLTLVAGRRKPCSLGHGLRARGAGSG